MSEIRIPTQSLEYVKAVVSADVTLDDTVTVSLSLSADGVHTWRPAQWVGPAATTRTARTSSPVDFGTLAKRSYTVYVKLVDNPEAPIMAAGNLVVV